MYQVFMKSRIVACVHAIMRASEMHSVRNGVMRDWINANVNGTVHMLMLKLLLLLQLLL